jgi:hypothetical protein
MRAFASLLSISLLVGGLSGCGGSPESASPTTGKNSTGPVRERLDCGSSKVGSEDALRQFAAILRRGNQREVRSVLIDRPRFFALSAYGHPAAY